MLPDPFKTQADLNRIRVPDVEESLGYVFDAIRLTKQELNNRVPLIGFAGAPWTLLCYMIEGKSSKTFDSAKTFCYTQPVLAHKLLRMLTETTIAYLRQQVRAGADIIQIFDSWGGLLSPDDFELFSLQYMRQIIQALKKEVPVILFAKGAWGSVREMALTGTSGLGLDWVMRPEAARALAGPGIILQGNLDPARLLGPIPEIRKEVTKMLDGFGPGRYIANLGHGILPNVPVDHAKAFVDIVKNHTCQTREKPMFSSL
jgi:uroporphyrinogen decarboxylase